MPLADASLNTLCTPSSVLISQLELKGQYRCIGLAPTVLSPLPKHVGHECAPLKLFILHTKACAGRSTEQVSILPRQIWMPSGVETLSPIGWLMIIKFTSILAMSTYTFNCSCLNITLRKVTLDFVIVFVQAELVTIICKKLHTEQSFLYFKLKCKFYCSAKNFQTEE